MEKESVQFVHQLYKDCYIRLYRRVFRLTEETNTTEEILQDVYITAWRNADLIQEHPNPPGWLFQTAANITKHYLRERYRMNRILSLDEESVRAEAESSMENDRLPEEQENMRTILQRYLNEEDSDILVKFYEDEYKITEIADQYGIGLSACKMRLKRAREKLIFKYMNEHPTHSENCSC